MDRMMDNQPGRTGTGTPGAHTQAHISSRPTTADELAREAESRAERARNRIEHAAEEARERIEDVGERASEAAHRARRTVNHTLDRAGDVLGDSGMLGLIRNNPMPAVAVAFGAGFLLAGSPSRQKGVRGMVRRQLRSALLGAVSATLTRELRNLSGFDDLVDDLFGGGSQSRRSPSPSGRRTSASGGY